MKIVLDNQNAKCYIYDMKAVTKKIWLDKEEKGQYIMERSTVLITWCKWKIEKLFVGDPAERRAYHFAVIKGFRLTAFFIVLRNSVLSTTTTYGCDFSMGVYKRVRTFSEAVKRFCLKRSVCQKIVLAMIAPINQRPADSQWQRLVS